MPVFQWAIMEANLDPVAGAEQKGTRPVLIASNEEYNQVMPNVTVLPSRSRGLKACWVIWKTPSFGTKCVQLSRSIWASTRPSS